MKTIAALLLAWLSINVSHAKAEEYKVEVNIEIPESRIRSYVVNHAKDLAFETLQELMVTLDCRYIKETPVRAFGSTSATLKTGGFIRGALLCPKPYNIVASVTYADLRSDPNVVILKVFLGGQQIQQFERKVVVKGGFC